MSGDNHETLPSVDLKDIQAGPIVSPPTLSKGFFFFRIKDASDFKILFSRILPMITNSEVARELRAAAFQAKRNRRVAEVSAINVAFSQTGLTKLLGPGTASNIGDADFKAGQPAQAAALGDNINEWLLRFKSQIDGVFILSGDCKERVTQQIQEIKAMDADAVLDEAFVHIGNVRPGKFQHDEHFGFRDGISQPYVKIDDDASRGRAPLPGQMVVNPGVLLQGKSKDPVDQRPNPGLSENGSILVYRHLKQLVPEFDAFMRDTVVSSLPTITHPSPPQLEDEIQKRINYLAARLMGRWKSGLPVVLTPKEGNGIPVDDPVMGGDPQKNNDFVFEKRNGTLDQSKCPFAAHIRKTTPRNDISAAAGERSAILRAGIPYGCEVTPEERDAKKTSHERGLSFVCYQSSLNPGFVFMQQSWCNNPDFISSRVGFDPIVGQALKDSPNPSRSMTGWDADNLSKELTIPKEFVISQGGEYFFSPSMTVLQMIAKPRA